MPTTNFLAFGPAEIGAFIPIIIFLIPIIAILTAHQRKMAELYHSRNVTQYNPEIAALRQEMQELRQLVHQQTIALDNLASMQTKITPGQTVDQQLANRTGS